MRRILAAGMLAGVLLGAAACADSPVTPAASSSAGAAATTSAAPAGADTKAVCDKYKAAEAAVTPAVTAAITKITQAAGDATKTQAALTELSAAFTTFQGELTAAASASVDPALKAAIQSDVTTLTTALAAMAASGGDAAKVQAALSSPEFSKAGEKVKELCGA